MILSLRNRLRLLVYIGAATLFVVGLLGSGPRVAGITIGKLSIVETILLLTLGVFDRWLWRQSLVLRVLKSGPLLRGTWKGKVVSADTGKEYEAYLSVRQTYTQIEVRLMTEESTSESTSCQLIAGPEGLATIEYVFQNVPRPAVRSQSPIHFGAARVECVGQAPASLAGSYWTDRRTSGEMSFDVRVERIVHSFDDARNAFR